MTHPAFILIPLVIPFTFSFYLWFIPTVENTAHFLVAQIKLKQLFLLSPYSSWTYVKQESKSGPWLGRWAYFHHIWGNQGFIPKDHIQTSVAFHIWKLTGTKKVNHTFQLTVSCKEWRHLYFLGVVFCLHGWYTLVTTQSGTVLHLAGKQKNTPGSHQITDS